MISVRGLTHRYGAAQALRLPEWNVAQGERWLVLGPSGCGKTTLLHVLAGLIRPTEGRVEVAGQELGALSGSRLDRWRGATVGIVLQALHLVGHLNVRDNLRLAQYMAHMPQDDARIAATLATLGISDKMARRPADLSEGERQRVAIARGVVNRPKLLLAVEQAERHGATLVVATHDARVKQKFEKRLELSA